MIEDPCREFLTVVYFVAQAQDTLTLPGLDTCPFNFAQLTTLPLSLISWFSRHEVTRLH